jgi:hypothetical protein
MTRVEVYVVERERGGGQFWLGDAYVGERQRDEGDKWVGVRTERWGQEDGGRVM